MISERKKELLKMIIQAHLEKAEPIGSGLLVDKISYSSATIRNEMVELEKGGYIYQPHTSAGRVPTEKGYHFYVENLSLNKSLAQKNKEILKKTLRSVKNEDQRALKELAKKLSDLSSEAIMIGFTPHDVYYTGLSYLFSKPEFSPQKVIYNLSAIIDHLDEVMSHLFKKIKDDQPKIMIGGQNPFYAECSLVVTQYKISGKNSGLLGILGPLRMDYENNFALLKYSRELISDNI